MDSWFIISSIKKTKCHIFTNLAMLIGVQNLRIALIKTFIVSKLFSDTCQEEPSEWRAQENKQHTLQGILRNKNLYRTFFNGITWVYFRVIALGFSQFCEQMLQQRLHAALIDWQGIETEPPALRRAC